MHIIDHITQFTQTLINRRFIIDHHIQGQNLRKKDVKSDPAAEVGLAGVGILGVHKAEEGDWYLQDG